MVCWPLGLWEKQEVHMSIIYLIFCANISCILPRNSLPSFCKMLNSIQFFYKYNKPESHIPTVTLRNHQSWCYFLFLSGCLILKRPLRGLLPFWSTLSDFNISHSWLGCEGRDIESRFHMHLPRPKGSHSDSPGMSSALETNFMLGTRLTGISPLPLSISIKNLQREYIKPSQ